jgi:integration host factor subunit alpha
VKKFNFTKRDISKNLSQNTGFPINYSKKLIKDLLFILSISIKEGNLNIKNIGSFKLSKKNERKGRNPKTKEEFIITKRNSINFTTSKNLTKLLNSNK